LPDSAFRRHIQSGVFTVVASLVASVRPWENPGVPVEAGAGVVVLVVAEGLVTLALAESVRSPQLMDAAVGTAPRTSVARSHGDVVKGGVKDRVKGHDRPAIRSDSAVLAAAAFLEPAVAE
jgi:hypothetical protein